MMIICILNARQCGTWSRHKNWRRKVERYKQKHKLWLTSKYPRIRLCWLEHTIHNCQRYLSIYFSSDINPISNHFWNFLLYSFLNQYSSNWFIVKIYLYRFCFLHSSATLPHFYSKVHHTPNEITSHEHRVQVEDDGIFWPFEYRGEESTKRGTRSALTASSCCLQYVVACGIKYCCPSSRRSRLEPSRRSRLIWPWPKRLSCCQLKRSAIQICHTKLVFVTNRIEKDRERLIESERERDGDKWLNYYTLHIRNAWV